MKKKTRKRDPALQIIEHLGVPLAELADYLQHTHAWIEKMLVPRGMPTANDKGLFPLMACLRWYSKFRKKLAWKSEFGRAYQFDRMDWLAALVRKEIEILSGANGHQVDEFLVSITTPTWMYAALHLTDGRVPVDVKAIIHHEVRMAMASEAHGKQAKTYPVKSRITPRHESAGLAVL